MAVRRIALFILVSIFLVQPIFASDWPMSRRDASQRGAADDSLKLPLALAWQYNTVRFANNPSAPAIVGGVAYFASGDRVYAVDADFGALKWRYPAEQSLSAVIRSSPAVHNGVVYFGAGDGNLYAISADDGKFLWAFATGGAIRSSPIVVGDTVFVGSDDDHLYAINADTGASLWGESGFRTRGDIPHAPAAWGGIVTFAAMDLHIYGASQSTGRTLWAYRTVSSAARSSPVISDNTVYIGTGSVVYGLSLRSGLQKLGITLPSDVAGTPAISERDLYVVCRDKKLYAFAISGRNVKPKWQEPAELTFTPTSGPTVAGDLVFVAGDRGVVAAFSAEDGSMLWRYVIAPAWVGGTTADYTNAASSPIVANGRLYVLTDDGALHCFTSDAADNSPPEVFDVMPSPGWPVSGSPPVLFQARLFDLGTGIDPDSIQLEVNGERVEHQFNYLTSTLSYETPVTQPVRPMADGRHTALVRATDWAGNVQKYEWSFIVDNRLRGRQPPRARAQPAPETEARARPTARPVRHEDAPEPPSPDPRPPAPDPVNYNGQDQVIEEPGPRHPPRQYEASPDYVAEDHEVVPPPPPPEPAPYPPHPGTH